MAEITLEEAPQRVRDIFNRGFSAFERGTLDYAIELLSTCLEMEPRLLSARRYLRAAQVQKRRTSKAGLLDPVTTLLRGMPLMLGMRLAGRKDPARALALAENLMSLNPLRSLHVRLLADAAVAADLPEVAVQALQMARESLPRDTAVLRRLGDLYASLNMAGEARKCFEKLTELCPNDHDVIKAYKDAMARESMVRDGWIKAGKTGGTFRDAVRNIDTSDALDHEAKAARPDEDVDGLIAEIQAKLKTEPDNLNNYRALARLYVQKEAFTEALEALDIARQRRSGDPEFDAAWSGVKTQQFDYAIDQLLRAGDEAGAAALRVEKDTFVQLDLEDRMARYPADVRLRYDLGRVYYAQDRITDAIKQLQAAQRSPKHRIMSLYYLALCFRRKGQADLALDQLKTASGELAGMDDAKKAILYELGDLLAEQGRAEESLECFRRIYQVDIGYRDIATRVEGGNSAEAVPAPSP